MDIEKKLAQGISKAFTVLFEASLSEEEISFQPTRKEFEGSYTFVIFPYLKVTKRKPEEAGQLIGEYLTKNIEEVAGFNVVKGFLNLVITNSFWVNTLGQIQQIKSYGKFNSNGKKVMVEYSSPNTNKPLHLGHLRNNFLGYSLANILEANGYEVLKANLVNDRGIHICKSMVAYQKFGNAETPSASLKGDKLVGNYYVRFDQEYKKQIASLLEEYKKTEPDTPEKKLKEKAEKNAPILLEAQSMLIKWEQSDKETTALWAKMNGWVYDGFDQSYQLMGVSFDTVYKESETYLLGKDVVEEGLEKGVFFKKEDGSVWINLEAEKLDEKLLLRADGTSVYMTQDMGTADMKFKDFPMEKSVYVVGNEQEYHFKVLQIIMQKLGRSYADGIYHLSYGMVDLPSGKMKSREGTVVDADDLILEMKMIAKSNTKEQGKIDEFSDAEAEKLYLDLALGALKFYLLRVDPKKRILFNPEESIDFQGDTGVYVQYNHARLCAIVRKAKETNINYKAENYVGLTTLNPTEVDLVALLKLYPEKVQEAAKNYAPSVIASFALELARTYSKFYAEVPIFNEKDKKALSFRIALSEQVATTLQNALGLLGIRAPERM